MMKKITAKPKIYLVDDDDAVRKALSRLLKAAGYTGEAFASAEDFLAAVPAGSNGILLLDLRMPGIDGFTLQKRLQTLCPQLPVVFITGHAQPGDRERALAAGAKGFLTKPFDGKILLCLLESIAQKNKGKEG
jgi:FixJ family two-component response regulator